LRFISPDFSTSLRKKDADALVGHLKHEKIYEDLIFQILEGIPTQLLTTLKHANGENVARQTNFVYVSVKGTSNFDGEMRIGFSTARDLKVDTSMTSLVSKTRVLHLRNSDLHLAEMCRKCIGKDSIHGAYGKDIFPRLILIVPF